MTHHTDERATLLKIERSLMGRSLDEWVMETGAVALNSSWHGELAAIVRMAFDKGVEVEQAASRAPAPVLKEPTSKQIVLGAGALLGQPEHTADNRHPEWHSAVEKVRKVYLAMLAAAPQPSSPHGTDTIFAE